MQSEFLHLFDMNSYFSLGSYIHSHSVVVCHLNDLFLRLHYIIIYSYSYVASCQCCITLILNAVHHAVTALNSYMHICLYWT